MQEAWEDVIAPWFDQVVPGAWQRELPSTVVVPTRGQADDIKARLIANGRSHLGLQFVTPSSLRAVLERDDATPNAQPELLRLLLAIAATEIENRPDESEALAAKAVVVPLRYYCGHWIGSKLPVGNSKNSGCHRLRQWFTALTRC